MTKRVFLFCSLPIIIVGLGFSYFMYCCTGSIVFAAATMFGFALFASIPKIEEWWEQSGYK